MATSDHVPEVCFQVPILKVSVATLCFLCPQIFLSDFYEIKNEILIPSVVASNVYFLGPMGDPYPYDFIRQETNQILFKQSAVVLSSWNTKTLFRNWPKMPK